MMLLWNIKVCSICPLEKKHFLRNFNSAKVCEGAWGRGYPQEVDVDPQSQGMEADGRVSSRDHACINDKSFLSRLKKHTHTHTHIRNWFWIWRKVYTTIEDICGFCHLVPIFLLLVLVSSCHPGKSPVSFSLTQYDYDRVDFTSNSRSGHVAQAWPIGALLSSSCVDIIQPMTLWEL